MSFLEMLNIQKRSMELSTRQSLLIIKINHEKKVKKKDWEDQKKLLNDRLKIIDEMKEIYSKSNDPIEKMTIEKLMTEQELQYMKSTDEAKTFEANFVLKEGMYFPKEE